MRKYVLAELILIAILILAVFIHRHIVFNLNPIISNALFIVFIIIFIAIILIIPAMIMLSLRDKISSTTKPANSLQSHKITVNDIIKFLIIIILSWAIYFIGKANNSNYSILMSGIIASIGFSILYKDRGKSYSAKEFLIFIALITITFISVVIIFTLLFSVLFHI